MSRTCPQCNIGRIRPTTAPYVIDYFGHPLIYPNAPAHGCDVCRYLIYDTAFLFEFDHLMDQFDTTHPANRAVPPVVVQP